MRVNFLGVATNQPFPADKQWRMDQLRQAWENGAAKMRENLEFQLRAGYHDCISRMSAHGVPQPAKQLVFARFEDMAKLFVLKRAPGGLLHANTYTRGLAVANFFYRRLKPQVEERANFPIYRDLVPYPSTELNSLRY